MKITRLFLFIGLLTTSAFVTSCEKTYKCTCIMDEREMKTSNIKAKKKKDATLKCDNMQIHSNEECKLK